MSPCADRTRGGGACQQAAFNLFGLAITNNSANALEHYCLARFRRRQVVCRATCVLTMAALSEGSLIAAAQLFGAMSNGGVLPGCCLPVLNWKMLRNTPGAIAEIGLTRTTGLPGVPTTS
jgi:hypothetical protein